MKRISFIFAQVCLFILVSASIVRAQNHVQTITVTNGTTTITADGNYNQVLVRENAASPSAAFSITLAGTSIALNYPAGTQFVFYGNFSNGQAIGTIQATTAGPFTFIAVEASGPPSMSVKNTILSGGSSGNATSIQGLAVSSTAPTGGVNCFETNSGDTQALWTPCGSGGTVTTFSAGNLSPLFVSNVATATSTPALTFTLSNAAANLVFGNCTGSTAAPSYCSLTGAMLPNPGASSLGAVESISVVSHNFLTGISTSGVPTQAQPAFTDISGSLACSQMPALTGDATTSAGACATTVSALKGISLPTLAASTGFLYDNNGTLSLSASASNLTSGTLPHAQLPTLLSGDIPNNAANTSGSAASLSATLAIASGGTNAASAANALINLNPVASEVGDIVYCSAYSSGCTAWTILAGNTSGTKVLQETSSGVPSWVVGGGGSGTINNCSVSTGAISYYSATGTTVSCDANIQDLGSGELSLGIAGTQAGSLRFTNATSGSITLQPATGALGSPVITLPASSGTIALAGSLTANGIVYATSTTTVASTAALTQYGVMYGGGAGSPSVTAAGTAGVPLKGAGSGAAPSFQSDNTCVATSLTDQVSTAATFATTCSIANTNIGAATVIEVLMHGSYVTSATSSPKFAIQVNAGGTSGICPAPTTAIAISASVTAGGTWDAVCRIVILTTGSSGTALAGGEIYIGNGAGIQAANNGVFSNDSTCSSTCATVAYNTTTSETVSVQETATTVSGQTINLQSLIVRVIP